jgi:hexosaminidase
MSSYHLHGRWVKALLGCIVLPFVAMVVFCASATGKAATPMAPALIPYPVKLEARPGAFQFADKSRILVNVLARPTGDYLSDVLASALAVRLSVAEETTSVSTGNMIVHISSDAELGEEGYRMDVEPTAVRISAATAAGAFYGVQTLRQLIATENNLSSNTSAVQRTISACTLRISLVFTGAVCCLMWAGTFLRSKRLSCFWT